MRSASSTVRGVRAALKEFCALPALAVCEWKETADELLVESNAVYNEVLAKRVLAILASASIAVTAAALLPLS